MYSLCRWQQNYKESYFGRPSQQNTKYKLMTILCGFIWFICLCCKSSLSTFSLFFIYTISLEFCRSHLDLFAAQIVPQFKFSIRSHIFSHRHTDKSSFYVENNPHDSQKYQKAIWISLSWVIWKHLMNCLQFCIFLQFI